MKIRWLVLVGLVQLAVACAAGGKDEKKAEKVAYTGTLKRVVAIGGETSGWRLLVEENQEKKQKKETIDVDVTKVKKEAEALEGKKVTISGTMTEKTWPERGKVKVLVGEKIGEEKE
jgi:hypothetical protein